MKRSTENQILWHYHDVITLFSRCFWRTAVLLADYSSETTSKNHPLKNHLPLTEKTSSGRPATEGTDTEGQSTRKPHTRLEERLLVNHSQWVFPLDNH